MRRMFANICLIILVTMPVLGQGLSASITPYWDKNVANGNRPTWFSALNYETGMAYGRIGGQERLYVLSRNGGLRPIILNAESGDSIGMLRTDSIVGGTYLLNDIETSADGAIFACNLTTNAQTTPFKIYLWNNESTSPILVVSYNRSAIRLGDKFTVIGSLSDNSAEIFAAAMSSNVVLKYHTQNMGYAWIVDTIKLSGASSGYSPSVAPLCDGTGRFFIRSNNQYTRLYSSSGILLDSIPPVLFGLKGNAARCLQTANRMALASFSYDTGSSGSILDVSGGPQNSRLLGKIPSLGSVSNVNGTGDISIRKNSEGSFTVYVLATNNGLSALNVVLTAINKPTIPIIVSSTPLDRSIRLVWQACSDSTVDHYRIYVDTIPAPQVIWDSTSGGRFDTIRTIINLQNGFRYYIRITAVDYRGIESDFSNEISAVPQPPSNTVNVTFQFNTSTVLDTITSQSLIQIRGDQSPLTWDNSSVRMTCTGGDYWLATVRFPKGITIQYKYYVSQPGWENNSNRILVVGQNDTLLPLHYYNSQVPFVGTDSIDIYFRVNMLNAFGFDSTHQAVGVVGSNYPLNWSNPSKLRFEGWSAVGSFWSGVVRFPSYVFGSNLEYQFVIYQRDTLPARILQWEYPYDTLIGISPSGNRFIPSTSNPHDTTLYWRWWKNKINRITGDSILVRFLVNTSTYPDTLKSNSFVQIRGNLATMGGWSDTSPARLQNIGGDYWTALVPVKRGDYVYYKIFANPNNSLNPAIIHTGWEAGFSTPTSNREFVAGQQDTIGLLFFNSRNDAPIQTWSPIPVSDSISVMFRVNMQKNAQFNRATQFIGVRGSEYPLRWDRSILLKRELPPPELIVNYDATHFWSAVINFPRSVFANILYYQFVLLNSPSDTATVVEWESPYIDNSNISGGNRFIPTIHAPNDTTLYWQWWRNDVRPLQSKPSAPQYLEVIPGDKQVTLHWSPSASSGVFRYRIYGGTNPLPTTKIDSSSYSHSDTLKVISGLTNGIQYYFRVTAVDTSQIESDYSYQVSATPNGALAAPILLLPLNGSADNIMPTTFLWKAVLGATSYTLQVGTTPDLSSSYTNYSTSDTNLTVNGIQNTTYYWRVSANAAQSSNWSQIWSFTTRKILEPISSYGWKFEKTFFRQSSKGQGVVGVAVDPAGKIWIIPSASTETIGGKSCRAIYVFLPDGSQTNFSPISRITVQGITDTLFLLSRGISIDHEGNILYAINDVLYRIDYRNGIGLNKIIPKQSAYLTTASADSAGNICVGFVLPTNPILIFDKNFNFLRTAIDSVPGYARATAISKDGRNIFRPSFTDVKLTRYYNQSGVLGSYLYADEFNGLAIESMAWQPGTNLLWISSGSDANPPKLQYPKLTWYAYDSDARQFLDTISWNINAGTSVGRPRGIAFSPSGDTAYVGCFYIDTNSVQMFTRRKSAAPTVPQLLAAVPGDSSVLLTWKKNPESTVVRYGIYGGTSPSSNTKIDSTSGGSSDTTRLIRNLTNGTTYYFRLTAVDANGGESSYSNELSAIPTSVISPPILFSPDNASTNLSVPVTFQWSAVPGAQSYNLQIATDRNFNYVRATIVNISANTLTTGLVLAGVNQFWRVRTITATGASNWSETWSLSTAGGAIPPVVSTGWKFSDNFFPQSTRLQGIVGMAVDPEGKVWIAPSSPTESLLVAGSYRRISAIYILYPDGRKASFSPITIISGTGYSDTIATSARSLSLYPNGNILYTASSVVYRINFHTGKIESRYAEPGSSSFAGAGCDTAGNIYISRVIPGPIQVLDSSFAPVKVAVSASLGYARSLSVSKDGKFIYRPDYSSARMYRYISPTGPSGTYTLYDSLLFGLSIESLAWDKLYELLYISSGSDYINPTPPYSKLTWYGYNPKTNSIVDTIGWIMKPENATARPRAIAFTPTADTVYVGCYGIDTNSIQRFIRIKGTSRKRLIGDFTGDGRFGMQDLALFAKAWREKDLATGDIGPATGRPPDLIPQKDGVINFEDLMVFTLMWNWAGDNSLGPLPLPKKSYQEIRPATIAADINTILKEHETRFIPVLVKDIANIYAASLRITYNPQRIRLDVLASAKQNDLLSFIIRDDKKGEALVALASLQKPLDELLQNKEAFRYQITALTKLDNEALRIIIEAYDSTGSCISMTMLENRYSWRTVIPESFELAQNFPNPFNPRTTIKYQIPVESKISIIVYNLIGQEQIRLLDGFKQAGYYEVDWNGVNALGVPVPSGVYIYRVETESNTASRKMLLIR